jgi:hypothetical protein
MSAAYAAATALPMVRVTATATYWMDVVNAVETGQEVALSHRRATLIQQRIASTMPCANLNLVQDV